MQTLEPPVQLHSVTIDDIQRIIETTISDFIQNNRTIPKIIWLDTSYLYTFDLKDFELVRRYNLMIRYGKIRAIEWHRKLERWCQDQTTYILGVPIKPTAITSTFDRVPNEGLINLANAFTGKDFNIMNWHAIGTGAIAGTNPSPSATALVTEQSRINVLEDPNGGSLSTEGSTVFVVGNHPISTATGTYTETGVFDAEHTEHDSMGDYSIFPDEIDHAANANAIGSTTVIFQCST